MNTRLMRCVCVLSLFVLPAAFAQTWTACNPLNTTNCPVDPALGTNATFNWNGTMADSKIWNATNGTPVGHFQVRGGQVADAAVSPGSNNTRLGPFSAKKEVE